MYHEVQMRMFRMFLKKEDLKEKTQEKWERILAAKGLTWGEEFGRKKMAARQSLREGRSQGDPGNEWLGGTESA